MPTLVAVIGASRTRRFGALMLRHAARVAIRANITGMASMVAYNALMSVVPIALLALFAVSLVLESPSARAGLLADLQQMFPSAAQGTLTSALTACRARSRPLPSARC